ncbi:hypothetical protein OIE13_28650 [Streptosporangium sp. NBC_01810]|uniref:hypothetical protein n=1 Tax=Streptosporangium sp. NBC_01810 TaxID=2975951 RepID=UPI002DDBCF5D|nr:hypothetical protein [Streptosporangium sp. NBC_01810]WSA24873.1 hypothetical protein OIE13_28650 [Streptosporangium sp. NBC_01810]
MSNASRNIRGILAVALLTAGTGWTLVSPASAEVAPCQEREAAGAPQAPGAMAAACEEVGDAGGTAAAEGTTTTDNAGTPATTDGPGASVTANTGETPASTDGAGASVTANTGETPASTDGAGASVTANTGEMPVTADRLAHVTELPDLSQASALVSFADAGGVAAGTGFHALPFGLSSPPSHEWTNSWVGIMAEGPDLPGLPGAPGAPGDGISWLRAPVPPAPERPAGAAVAPDDDTAPLPQPAQADAVTEDLPSAEPSSAEPPSAGSPVAESPAAAGPEAPAVPDTSAGGAHLTEGSAEVSVLPALERTIPDLNVG